MTEGHAPSPYAAQTARSSDGRLIRLGMLRVNLPTALIWFGGWFAPALVLPQPPKVPIEGVPENWRPLAFVIWMALPPAAAWLWWAFSAAKWRLWALERTHDWRSLEQRAIRWDIISNEGTVIGRIIGRTEIWTKAERQRETDLLAHYGLPPRHA